MLAQACLEVGAVYFGICTSQTHLTWLTNVLDRASLKWLTQSGSCLYQDELANHVQELFSDVLEEGEDDENQELSEGEGDEE